MPAPLFLFTKFLVGTRHCRLVEKHNRSENLLQETGSVGNRDNRVITLNRTTRWCPGDEGSAL